MNESAADISKNSTATDLEDLDYLREVKSSTCLLLSTTPSPTPLDFKHPLSEELSDEPFLGLNESTSLQNDAAVDSSSSGDSNSVVQDPVSAQLINNISMLDYQTLSKNGDLIIGQAEDCKLNGNLKIKNRKLPSFVNWNWPLLRKLLLWVALSGLIACLAAIIGMVVTIPKECNPDLPWYQGKVFYEIFPASFKDSNNDGTGDFKGLIKKLDYIQDLGISAIRLNYIYESDQYPENYNNITTLLEIDRSLGVLKDFQDLVAEVHKRGMFIILDIPVVSIVMTSSTNLTLIPSNDGLDLTSIAITYWARAQGVDGFYLKNLENFVHEINFGRSLQIWKSIVGNDKILIANEKAYDLAKEDALNILLSRIDLIDIHLDLQAGISGLKKRVDTIISGNLWAKPHYPWVHWNIGNVNSDRIATKHPNNTLVMIALELVLPGTISIFYGDEIGLGGNTNSEVENDFHEHKFVENLVHMLFDKTEKNGINILPWSPKSDLKPKYDYLEVIKNITKFRLNTPTIYLRAIYKDGNIQKNMDIRKTEENLFVIERWYPRRNTCVFVGNLGNETITTDLSSMFYGGNVVAGTNASLIGEILYFDKVTFPPYSAVIFKLDK